MSFRRKTARGNRGRVHTAAVSNQTPPATGGGSANTTDVIGVGAATTDNVAVNNANDKVVVGS